MGAGGVLQEHAEDLSLEGGEDEWAGEAFVEDCVLGEGLIWGRRGKHVWDGGWRMMMTGMF